MGARAARVTAADLEAWARYLRHVTPLPGVSVPQPAGVPLAVERALPVAAPAAVAPVRVSVSRRTPLAIGIAPPGLDRATWGRFRAGKIPPERVLDLHGMTKPNAHVAVTRLIAGGAAQGMRCIEIVTGHGRRAGGEGVLRREVPFWLNDAPLRPLILAVCHPHAANEGSLLVLLRRNRP